MIWQIQHINTFTDHITEANDAFNSKDIAVHLQVDRVNEWICWYVATNDTVLCIVYRIASGLSHLR